MPMSTRVLDAVRHASWLRDPLTVRFNRRSAGVLLLFALLAVLGVAGKFHQSSIAKWYDYMPSAEGEVGLLFGEPRAVRSDEWLVSTPWMMSQVQAGLPEANSNVGDARSPLVTSLPVRAVGGVFQPELWGFHVLDQARGFSWLWMYRLFGLLASFFLLLLVLTRGDATVSAIGAASIAFASFNQWWFSTNLPELLVAMAIATIGALYIGQSRSRTGILAGALMLTVWGAAFVLQFYPPFQVACGYVSLALVAGLFFEGDRRRRFVELLPWRLAAVAASAVALAVLFWMVWHDSRSTIEAVMGTAYPGSRSTSGGNQELASTLNGIFEPWRIGEESFPKGRSNPSEASNFPLFFPLVLLALLFPTSARRGTALQVALLVLCTAFLAWMTIPLPQDAATAVAKLTLLSFVPPHRALLAVGIGSALLVAVWVSAARRSATSQWRIPIAVALAGMLLAAALAAWLHHVDPVFYTPPRLFAGIAITGLVGWAGTRGRAWPYAAAVGLMAIPALTVNPLARGLAPLMGRQSMQLAVRESRSRPEGVLWMVAGSFVVPQALKANGIPTFGGATFLPDRDRMRVLDPDGRHEDVWSRYAHLLVTSTPGQLRPGISLIDPPGLYAISVDVCSAAITALGVTHVVYVAPPPRADLGCLRPLVEAPVDGLWMYRRVPVET